jgi:hypothetical protein
MATIKIKRGTTDPSATNVTNSGELAANTSTPKLFIKTADDSLTAPVWIGAQIESSPSDWTSATKLATQSAVNTTFMPKSGGTFTGAVSFGQGSSAAGELRLLEDSDDGTNYSAFRGSARTANITYVMPTTDPTSGQMLSAAAPSSNVSQLSWTDASATTVSTTSDNTNTTRYLVFSTTAGSSKTLYVDDTTTPLSYNPSTSSLGSKNLSVSESAGIITSNIFQSYGVDANLSISSTGSDTSASITITGAATPSTAITLDAATITLNGNGVFGVGSTSLELPGSFTIADTATSTNTLNIQTGATGSGNTKTINIGTGAASGSTTNINLGSSNGGTVTVNKDLVVSGNFTVNGTTTTVNSTTLSIDDKNIVLGADNTLDSAADGGGITLKGASDKTFNWVDATDAWTSSEHLNLLTGKAFYINGSSVLSASTLGSGVTSSSLTSVGTIGTGTWQGTAVGAAYGGTGQTTYTVGDIIYASGSTTISKLSASSTAGAVLSSTGSASAPQYKTISLTNGSVTSGSGTLTLAIQDASADGSTKGLATFNSSDFNSASGVITIDTVDGGTY